MRKLVVLGVLVGVLGVGLPARADTTVIKGHTRTDTTTCGETDQLATVTHTFKRNANKWVVTKLTAKNPCDSGTWFFIGSSKSLKDGAPRYVIALQGGGKISWDANKLKRYGLDWHVSDGFGIGLDNELDPACEKGWGVKGTIVDSHGKAWTAAQWRAKGLCF